jgi:chromosomal replication initiation ATPase DnaA
VTDPFASFLPDPATAAAVAAARTVAEAGAGSFTPLVVTGARGAGKSFLLRAIQARAEAADPPRRVELLSLGRLAETVETRSWQDSGAALRDRLVRADLVLLDDFEGAVRHLPIQGFVVDLLESRLTQGRGVVVASSIAPDQLSGLDSRLARRLEHGTTVELGLPGREARIGVLRDRAAANGVTLGEDVIEAVAGLAFDSIREYLGAQNRIVAFQQASPNRLSAAEALALIGIEPGETEPSPPPPVGSTPEPLFPGAEFESFVSDVVANLNLQFDQWRTRLREAIGHWQAQGIETRTLERLLTDEMDGDPEPIIAQFNRDAAELGRLAAEARAVAPDLAGGELFQDPEQLVAARAALAQARGRRAPLAAPLADLSLATLGIGPSNRLAVEAARAGVAEPGTRYSPLVLIGPSGVGKTHLLHGIGNGLVERGLTPVTCLSGHAFLGEVAHLKTADELVVWRNRYRWVAGLLIDDLHVLAGERRAQDELLQLFTALAESGRAMVFSSARRLSDLDGFDPRLLTRLEGGLVVEISGPDREVRLAVVKQALGGTPAGGDATLIDYLAARPADSARAVQGAVQRVLGEAGAQKTTPSAAFAREVLEVVETKPARNSKRFRNPASGILSPGLGVVKSREKMIQTWPTVADLLISELR